MQEVLVPFLEHYLVHHGYSPRTVAEYVRLAKPLMAELSSLEDLTPDRVKSWVASADTQSKRRHRWLAANALSKALDDAGVLKVNLIDGMKMPPVRSDPQPILSEEDLERLVADCDRSFIGIRDRALILAFASTGARRTEMAGLRHTDVNCVQQTVFIAHTKGGSQRVANLDRRAVRAMNAWLLVRGVRDTDALWVGVRGQPLSSDGIGQMLARRGKRLGIHVSAHMFRRYLALQWLLRGGSETGLKAAAGWKSNAMVERYTAAAKDVLSRTEFQRLFDT